MISMTNIGAFFALASEQLRRCVDINYESRDRILSQLLPWNHHPTRGPRLRRLLDLVPAHHRLMVAATCAWAGFGSDDHIVHWSLHYAPDMGAECEGLARMVDSGSISAPADAPCRSWPWAAVANATKTSAPPALMHQLQRILGTVYFRRFLAAMRDRLPTQDNWVPLTPKSGIGLAWVVGPECDDVGGMLALAVIDRLTAEQGQHWLGPELVDAWTPDSLVAWAEVCADYVEARRCL